MSNPFLDVLDFHRTMNLTIGDFKSPSVSADQEMRLSLIVEELAELLDALGYEYELSVGDNISRSSDKSDESENIVAAADALADLQYVINGAAVTWGLDLSEVHKEVHRSNMTKVGGTRRADGKLLKPPGYKPPDIERVIKICRTWYGELLNERAGR